MKFKVGDSIIVARLVERSVVSKDQYIDKASIITRVYDGGTFKYHIKVDNSHWLWCDEELEHSEIYNSPLYQALL